MTYDKKEYNIKNIIDELNNEKIDFKEIDTSQSKLEDIFLNLIDSSN